MIKRHLIMAAAAFAVTAMIQPTVGRAQAPAPDGKSAFTCRTVSEHAWQPRWSRRALHRSGRRLLGKKAAREQPGRYLCKASNVELAAPAVASVTSR